ncbi:flavodoxin family protein [Rhodococcus chondri]|uniref:NAD(P)H-dependent oxidoreductase n=1 Tax=Rhodococcus chondri TaxID=3065941 RepID=A0ABU7JS83_9NOCA|nr:NAD(P)H-dependent oxidoreductase [Rhodococcus sp. CC-R104]MEE2032617.1 NAD(P)H-dependent oxidoreductase [Rhodococcus sp. CC-R104]
MTSLHALALNCTLKPSPAESSTDLMISHVLEALSKHDATSETVRVVDYDIRPGVEDDMGDGDQWPTVLERVEAADILLVATPTWLGNMSSVAQRVLERLDAQLSATDEENRPQMVGKVGIAAVVGNEDGAHKIIADLFQGLDDIGFSIPAQGSTYWNGEAMSGTDFKDLDEIPEAVRSTTEAVARNATHLARLLHNAPYPPYPG